MSPRKKLKPVKCIEEENKSTAECMDVQKQVTGERVADSGSCKNNKFCLSDLPNEVLLSIYSFLSPVDLEAISELGNERLMDLTFCIKKANFFSCRKVSPDRISAFFTIRRVLYVKELNFNYTLYVKPDVLCQLICRCRDITVLSIVECGIKYCHLLQIFIHCSQLEELSWNVEEVVSLTTANANNMKTVYLFCNSKEVSLRSIFFIVEKFPFVKNIWINFSSDAISELPFIGLWLKATSVFNSGLNKRVTLLTNSFQCISDASDLQFLRKMIDQCAEINPLRFTPSVYQELIAGNSTVPDYFVIFESNEQHEARQKELASHSQTFMCPPFVQLFSVKKDIAELLSQPSNAFTSVSVILTSEILDLQEDLVKSINEASGIKLKHLCMVCEGVTSPGSNQYPIMPLSCEESLAVCDSLEKLFHTSQYVTVLSLVTVHFTSGSPFKAISKLKFLRTLNIPSCAYFKGEKACMAHLESENFEFKDVVSNCALVEDFSLVCCADDHVNLTDSDLFPLKQWKELKELTLYCVIFYTFSFLRKVTDSCKKLQSFSLVTAATSCEYLYTTDVIYLLKNAKNLSFIRINEENFDPMYEGFWDAVGEAVNLEGICIITQSKVAIENQVILKAIKKLKYLHLFHFFAIRAADHLYLQIAKAIEDNGIVNYRMEKLCNINSFSSAASKRYYHQQPHFCCQHIHFRKFSSEVL